MEQVLDSIARSPSFRDVLRSCPMHTSQPAGREIELTGRVEQLPDDGRFVLLVPRSDGPSTAILELEVADIQDWRVLFEDTAGRKTCRLIVGHGATIRTRQTISDLPDALVEENAEDAEAPTTADPMSAWESAAWRTDPATSHAPASSPALPPPMTSRDTAPPSQQYEYTGPSAQVACVQEYEGQLYYYFPYGFSADAQAASAGTTGHALATPAVAPSGQWMPQPHGTAPAAASSPCRCSRSAASVGAGTVASGGVQNG